MEIGFGTKFEDVMDRTTIKYDNVVKQKLWSQMDPKDAKVFTLTILNKQLQKSKESGSGENSKTYLRAATGGGNSPKE